MSASMTQTFVSADDVSWMLVSCGGAVSCTTTSCPASVLAGGLAESPPQPAATIPETNKAEAPKRTQCRTRMADGYTRLQASGYRLPEGRRDGEKTHALVLMCGGDALARAVRRP